MGQAWQGFSLTRFRRGAGAGAGHSRSRRGRAFKTVGLSIIRLNRIIRSSPRLFHLWITEKALSFVSPVSESSHHSLYMMDTSKRRRVQSSSRGRPSSSRKGDPRTAHRIRPKHAAQKHQTAQQFQYLKPRTRHIPEQVVAKQWQPLSETAVQNVREILLATKRPVIMGQRDERRRIEAEAIVNTLVRKLEKKLPRIPFPPKSRIPHFDLNKLIEENVRRPDLSLKN